MTPESISSAQTHYISIGVIAWNEQDAIGPMLESLFSQSLFPELARRQWRCEVLCVANGCTDGTTVAAEAVFARQRGAHAHRQWFSCRVAELSRRGKLNAWNQFVHSLSVGEARYLFMMDADILLHEPDTLRTMLEALEQNPQANIAVDQPRKHISFQSRPGLCERLSLRVSAITGSAAAQLCAQLYCIRTEIARNLYLPTDLAACEDGFIKQVVCTDFLTRPTAPERIVLAPGAEHTFEAYTSPWAILKNQKRQLIGQTLVHILVDQFVPTLPVAERLRLGATLKTKDAAEPGWLKLLLRAHLRKTRFCWRLYPGLLTQRFRVLAKLNLLKRLSCLPAAAAGSLAALAASWVAWRALKAGSTDYWPQAQRSGLSPNQNVETDKRSSPNPVGLAILNQPLHEK